MTSKQKSLQSARGLWSKAGLSLGLCLSCIVLAGARAQTSSLAIERDTKLELIGSPRLTNGTYGAGIEITMPPGSHTYWKMPGDAGVPPVFSFSGSQNVASARVLYPAPRRITEAGLEAFGYVGHVTFPVVVTPADASKPTVLKADVSYAVCDKVCIPAHGTGSLELSPKGGGDEPAAIAAALAAVPTTATPRERGDLMLVRDPGARKPTWTLSWHGVEPVEDIFADAPTGFYFATRKHGPASWTLVADEAPGSQVSGPVAVSLTLARATRPLAVQEKLDLRSATR